MSDTTLFNNQTTIHWENELSCEEYACVNECPVTILSIKIVFNAKTRKRALHARMPHSTVYNTTVFTKKPHPTLVLRVHKLWVT